MYCPGCAAPNPDGAKFCRSCGIELEAVALALRGESTAPPAEVGANKSEPQTAQDWLAKHGEGVKGITTGVSLLVVSALIGVAMAFFVPGHIPWILAWAVLVGWMAFWGGIELGNGVAGVLTARSRLRLMGREGGGSAVDVTPQQSLTASEPPTITDPSAAVRPPPPLSVTEGTTRKLGDVVEK
jgi:zinc-ribbon domain